MPKPIAGFALLLALTWGGTLRAQEEANKLPPPADPPAQPAVERQKEETRLLPPGPVERTEPVGIPPASSPVQPTTQTVPPPPVPTPSTTAEEPLPQPAATPPPPPPKVEVSRDGRDIFPKLDLYLPEGEVDLKARKLIRNVLFESQINYKFVDGDISTFLRYKYYARNFTYKLGVFDTIEFTSVERVSRDFDRVRGGLLLLEYPQRYNRRFLGLLQVDGLTFGDVDRPDNNRNNIYTKIAYQQGTTFDERLNSIAGESRGRIPPVLTAFRDIGPQKLGLAVAVTQGLESIGGDFDYLKFEGEGLKRLDVSENSFFVTRAHLGTFFSKHPTADTGEDSDVPPEPWEQVDVPRYELFKLGGRGALKGVDDRNRGSDEFHVSNEYFFPVFRERDYRTWRIHWNNLYGIVYTGAGALGFERDALTEVGDYVVDAGLGFEASATIRDFEIFLSAVYAQTVRAPDELEGNEVRFSLRTSR